MKKHANAIKTAAFLLLVSASAWGNSFPQEASGTLIVTYQTGVRGERLDRIRFLVKDSKYQQQMYPKGSAYVDDDFCLSRMVVIEDLPKGEYTLEFVIPNYDQLFEVTAPRKFSINQDEVVKIDQMLPVRYASVEAEIKMPASATASPAISLHEDSSEALPFSAESKLNVSTLLPGAYTLVFQEIAGYKTPSPIHFNVGPSEQAGPFIGVYTEIR